MRSSRAGLTSDGASPSPASIASHPGTIHLAYRCCCPSLVCPSTLDLGRPSGRPPFFAHRGLGLPTDRARVCRFQQSSWVLALDRSGTFGLSLAQRSLQPTPL